MTTQDGLTMVKSKKWHMKNAD